MLNYTVLGLIDERVLNSKDKLLDIILENSLDLITFHDIEGRYEYVSPSIFSIVGWTEDELLGKSSYEFFHPEDAKRIEEESHNYVKNGERDNIIEYRYRCKDGSYKWLQTASQPIIGSSGEPEKILAVTRDVDKFIKLQDELKLNVRLAKETNRLAKVGGWEVNLVDSSVWWSDVVKEVHEVSKDFVPDLETGINFYAPEHREIIGNAVDMAIKTGEGWDLELDLITATGKRKAVRALGKVEFKDGKPIKLYGAFQDIDERRKISKETELLKARLETATRSGNVGVWDWDVVNNVLDWDERMFTLYGVKAEAFSGAYEAWQNGLHPDDKEPGDIAINKALAGEKEFNTQFKVIHPDGSVRHIRAFADVLRDTDGTPLRMVGVNYDITDSINRERDLRLSEEKFRGSFEDSAVGKAIVSLEGAMTQVNQAWCAMLGYTADELTKLTFQEFTHPDDLSEDLAKVTSLINGEADAYQMEKRYFKKNGEIVWVMLNVSIVRDISNQPLFFISEVQDITERKKFEQELATSESLFRSTFETGGIGKAMGDMTGKFVMVNSSFCDFIGYTEDELKTMRFADVTHPDEIGENLKGFKDLIEGKIQKYSTEKRYIRKDGEIVWGHVTSTIIKDADGKSKFSMGEIQNITSRKKMEMELEQKNSELNNLVDRLTFHNNQLKEYNNIVSHNLRAPVSNLNALMHLLKSSEGDDEAFISKQMDASIEKITETLDHLVEVVKIRENKEIAISELMLHDIYSRVRDQLLGKIMEFNVNIETNFSELSTVKYPQIYLESIFLNMMDNAIKYRSEKRPLKISINSTVNGKYNIINFADNGLGINLERHGSKMFKLHKTFHRHKDSKGFGLFMLKNQIEAMGGEISCESEEDKGTIFKVKLLKE